MLVPEGQVLQGPRSTLSAGPDPLPDLVTVRTIADLIRWAADTHGTRIAWTFVNSVDGGPTQEWSFAAVHRAVQAVAGRVSELTTDTARVALLLPNTPAFPLCWLGAAHAGRISVPINSAAQVADTAHVLRDSGASLVITTPERREMVAQSCEQVEHQVRILTTTELATALTAGTDDDAPRESVPHNSQRIVNIQYTSGTTGMPKGCMLSHTYWLEIARSLCEGFPGVGSGDVLYTAQPFSYIDPQWNAITALMAGARLVIDDKFSASRMWTTMRANGVTLFYCLGIMPAALLAQPDHPDDRKHRVRAVLASGIPGTMHAELERRWGVPWFEAFGMTESGADLAVTPRDHDDVVGRACIGRPHRGREAVVLSPEGNVLRAGQEGQLAIRGVGTMDGYWGRPDETDAIFRDGWLHTGDKVVQDEKGRFFYLGRYKEVIRRSGENISPREVEAVLESHPAVQVAAVIAEPDELRGQEIKAFVVLRQQTDLVELRSHCVHRLAPFKVPRYWAVRQSLPMTPSERVARAVLAADLGPVWDSSHG